MSKKNRQVQVSESSKLSKDEWGKIEAYWTLKKIKAAKPIPLPKLPNRHGSLPLKPPAPDNVVSESSALPSSSSKRKAPGFVTTKITNYSAVPQCMVGKLYMTFAGVDYVASAWVVGNKSIFTAGHCVFDRATNGWASNVLFVGRLNGTSNVGRWPIVRLVCCTAWKEDGDSSRDMGAGISARPIQPSTGKLGWLANYDANQDPYFELGYPEVALPGYPFDGTHMWQCLGSFIDEDDDLIEATGNLTGGCSGGPWASFKEGDWRAVGINVGRRGNGNRIFSAYFGDAFLNIIEKLKSYGAY